MRLATGLLAVALATSAAPAMGPMHRYRVPVAETLDSRDLPEPEQALLTEYGRLVRFQGSGLELRVVDGTAVLRGLLGSQWLDFRRRAGPVNRYDYLWPGVGWESFAIDPGKLLFSDDPRAEHVRSYERIVDAVEQVYRQEFWRAGSVEALHRLKRLPVARFQSGETTSYLAADTAWDGDLFLLKVMTTPGDAHASLVVRLAAPDGLEAHVEKFAYGLPVHESVRNAWDISVQDSDFGDPEEWFDFGVNGEVYEMKWRGGLKLLHWMFTHAEEGIGSLEENLEGVGAPDWLRPETRYGPERGVLGPTAREQE